MKKIDLKTIGEREFNVLELCQTLIKLVKVWSWGAHAYRNYEDKVLRFRVRGNHHKGHVYISLAWNDTFTVTLTSLQGNIKKTIYNVYIDVLVDTIDKEVEYIKEYAY
jgi:hypothetical protein